MAAKFPQPLNICVGPQFHNRFIPTNTHKLSLYNQFLLKYLFTGKVKVYEHLT